MPTAENAKLMYEAGQNATAMSALTDTGDQTIYSSGASLFSNRAGYEPVVRPNGLVTGGVTSAAVSGSDDVVDVSALTCYLAGVLTSVGASTDESITRPASAVAKVNSITVTSAGAIAVVAGTDGGSTTFSETRGAAGGPPYIPVGDIEIAQVRVTSDTSAAITSAEIFQVVGTHQERYDYPLWTVNYDTGRVTFLAALDACHTGDEAKKVYASYAAPIFAEISLASDFVPAETSHTVSSTQIYGSTLGSTSQSLNQGTFTAYLQDGVTDALVSLKDEFLWFKFYPNRYTAPYILNQGKLGISRTFPAGGNIAAACTISAESAAIEKSS